MIIKKSPVTHLSKPKQQCNACVVFCCMITFAMIYQVFDFYDVLHGNSLHMPGCTFINTGGISGPHNYFSVMLVSCLISSPVWFPRYQAIIVICFYGWSCISVNSSGSQTHPTCILLYLVGSPGKSSDSLTGSCISANDTASASAAWSYHWHLGTWTTWTVWCRTTTSRKWIFFTKRTWGPRSNFHRDCWM